MGARTPQLQALLDSLDADQAKVAAWTPADGNLRIIAPAGSGKTRSLVALGGRLVTDGDLRPEDVLIATFSNKGSKELVDRMSRILPSYQRQAMRIGTFHAHALRVARAVDPKRWEMTRCTDLGANARGPHTPAGWVLWRSAVEYGRMPGTNRPSLKLPKADPSVYALAADLLRSKGINHPADITKDEDDPKLPDFDEAWRMVLDAKADLNVWDFADVLQGYLEIISTGRNPETQRAVLLDEAQDNTKVLLDIARGLADAGSLVLVGDCRQTVHVWKGAYPHLFQHADQEIGARTLEIRTNYRSVPEIVQLSNRIAKDRPWALGSEAQPHRPSSAAAISVVCDEDPATWVAETIAHAVRRKGAKPGDYAILARTNAQLGLYEAALDMEGIPVAVVGGSSLFQHREVETVLCYCILAQMDALNSLERVVNYPRRFLGHAFVSQVRAAMRPGVTMLQAIATAGAHLPPGQRRGAEELHRTLSKLRTTTWADVPDAVLAVVMSGLKDKAKGGTPDEDRPALYGAAARTAKKFPDAVSFYEFSRKALTNATRGDGGDVGRVTLSTVHSAKGLEWKHVFGVATTGSFPYQRKVRHGFNPPVVKELEDERRLLYVLATRAQDALTFVYDDAVGCSPFVEDLGLEAVPTP